jgi:hypothetical protein
MRPGRCAERWAAWGHRRHERPTANGRIVSTVDRPSLALSLETSLCAERPEARVVINHYRAPFSLYPSQTTPRRSRSRGARERVSSSYPATDGSRRVSRSSFQRSRFSECPSDEVRGEPDARRRESSEPAALCCVRQRERVPRQSGPVEKVGRSASSVRVCRCRAVSCCSAGHVGARIDNDMRANDAVHHADLEAQVAFLKRSNLAVAA